VKPYVVASLIFFLLSVTTPASAAWVIVESIKAHVEDHPPQRSHVLEPAESGEQAKENLTPNGSMRQSYVDRIDELVERVYLALE